MIRTGSRPLNPFLLKKIQLQDGKASCESEYVFSTQDAGADFEQEGLTIRQTFVIGNTDEFTMSYRIINRGKNRMNAGFRVKNLPFRKCNAVSTGPHTIQPGPFPENKILMKPGVKTEFLSDVPRKEWNGETILVKSPSRSLEISAPDFDGIYFWSGSGLVSIELLTKDIILNPGEEKIYTITVRFKNIRLQNR
jgi:hypothetical protein